MSTHGRAEGYQVGRILRTAALAGLLSVVSCGRAPAAPASTPLPFADPSVVREATVTETITTDGGGSCASFQHDSSWVTDAEGGGHSWLGFDVDPSLGARPHSRSGYAPPFTTPSAFGELSCTTPSPDFRTAAAEVNGDITEERQLAPEAFKTLRRLGGLSAGSHSAADGYEITFPPTNTALGFTRLQIYMTGRATCSFKFSATVTEFPRLEPQVRAAASTLTCAT